MLPYIRLVARDINYVVLTWVSNIFYSSDFVPFSVITTPSHKFKTGETIEMQLMQRKKVSYKKRSLISSMFQISIASVTQGCLQTMPWLLNDCVV